MKRILLALCILWAFALSEVRAQKAMTFLADFSNFSFYNGCSDEYVLTQPGSYLHGVLRTDPTPSGFHAINRAAGHVMARGVTTFEEYAVTIVDDAIPLANLANVANFSNGEGSLQFFHILRIVQPSNPASGVFVANVHIYVSIRDGEPPQVKVLSMTGECH